MKTPINWDTHNQDTISFETRSNILNQSTSQNLKLAAYVHHQLWFHLEYPVIWLTEQGCMESIHQDTWRLPSQCRAPSSNRSPILHRTTLWQVWKLEKHEDLDLISNIRSETIFTNLYQSSSSVSSSYCGQDPSIWREDWLFQIRLWRTGRWRVRSDPCSIDF